MKKIAKSWFEKIYKENLFIMKLLVTHPGFLDDITRIRSKLKIPIDGFANKAAKNKWLGKNLSKLPPSTRSLLNENSVFHNAEVLIKKYQLRYNFLHYVEHYIFYNEIDAPKCNCDVSIGPDPRGIRSSKWISIKAYAPLTKGEIRQATKKLLELQKEFLPAKVTLDIRPKIDIDLALEIEKEMEKRKRVLIEKPCFYLEQVKKHLGQKEYEKVKKLYGYKVENEIEKYTSKNVAKKFFKTEEKDFLVRSIYSNIKKKRELLFG